MESVWQWLAGKSSSAGTLGRAAAGKPNRGSSVSWQQGSLRKNRCVLTHTLVSALWDHIQYPASIWFSILIQSGLSNKGKAHIIQSKFNLSPKLIRGKMLWEGLRGLGLLGLMKRRILGGITGCCTYQQVTKKAESCPPWRSVEGG